MEDAEYAIVTIGSMSGAGKDAVDGARDNGERVGLIRIKTFRPFPLEAIGRALRGVKALGVVDRSVSFGWNAGPVYQDILTATHFIERRIPVVSFIGGLSGADITLDHFNRVLETTAGAVKGKMPSETIWLNEND